MVGIKHEVVLAGLHASGREFFPCLFGGLHGIEGHSARVRTGLLADEIGSGALRPRFELFNGGESTVDLSGWLLRDADDSHGYRIPVGTLIQPGGYLTLDQGSFNFELDDADSARLFDPGGSALIDSVTWSRQPATTYGRCPNGSGSFAVTASVIDGLIFESRPASFMFMDMVMPS